MGSSENKRVAVLMKSRKRYSLCRQKASNIRPAADCQATARKLPPIGKQCFARAKPHPSQMDCDSSSTSYLDRQSRNAAAQLRRGNWLGEQKLRLPNKRQVSCRRFALVLGSAVGATRLITLVHASPRILRHPISDARGIANILQQTRVLVEKPMAGIAQVLVPG